MMIWENKVNWGGSSSGGKAVALNLKVIGSIPGSSTINGKVPLSKTLNP